MGIKVIARPPKAAPRYQSIQKEIAKQVGNVGRLHIQEREKVVSDFETEINFGYTVKVTPGQVTLNINVTNDTTEVSEGFSVGDLWAALDTKGNPPHVIKPKKPGGTLRFQTGYQPHTRPVARFGGPGQATGSTAFAKEVNHPGFPPRKFSEKINKRLRPAFLKAVSRGASIGWNKIR